MATNANLIEMPGRTSEFPSIEEQARQLVAGGWKAMRHDLWVSPAGAAYYGPHLAWEVMRGVVK